MLTLKFLHHVGSVKKDCFIGVGKLKQRFILLTEAFVLKLSKRYNRIIGIRLINNKLFSIEVTEMFAELKGSYA